ncbi:hypothetical protein [Salinispora tropica]|uniref:Uncharacterized protein n=1 Tax=Salinispora tropica (strain ATCC BAA-916 / DSM 44818 / JCM 13857 / NBRC 105044 / CNB-440) TaxID=369723 RepID=A4X152_SALTO|nr:hypothetical protein [Salinispora tropica]ABP52602.1 hypothetical protein Strop_0117 [Salinispora tropica CNB-440]
MAESAKSLAQQAEDRLEQVAEAVRKRFDELTEGRFSDQIKDGRFADPGDSGADQGHPANQHQRR